LNLNDLCDPYDYIKRMPTELDIVKLIALTMIWIGHMCHMCHMSHIGRNLDTILNSNNIWRILLVPFSILPRQV